MKHYILGITSLALLSGCSLIRELNQTTEAIQTNRFAVEMSTQSILDIDQAVVEATAAIDLNAQSINNVNREVKENVAAIQKSTNAIQENLDAVQKSTQMINQNVEAVKWVPQGSMLILFALLFLLPWIGIAFTNIRLKQLIKILKKRS